MAQSSADFSGLYSADEMEVSKIKLYENEQNVWVAKIMEDSEKGKKGTILLKDGKYDAATNQIKGTLVKPGGSMEIDATVSVKNNNQLEIVGKKFLMTRTFVWTKL